MLIYPLFAIPVYHGHVSNYEHLENVLNYEEEEYGTPGGWSCNVKTSFENKTQKDWMNTFLAVIQENVFEYLTKSFNLKEFDVCPELPWINVYEKGHFQELHSHVGKGVTHFSYSYYHRLPENSSQFKFRSKDTDYEHTYPWELKTQLPFTPQIKQHDIVIFPSWVDHFVTPHQSDSVRVSISGNFTVENIVRKNES